MRPTILYVCLACLFCPQRISAQRAATDTVRLQLSIDSIALEELEVKAKRTPAANSRWSDLQPVELVTAGGANGDLYKALQTLPGTQVQGESGELLVRGGSSHETQTYIDGMHVLVPYTSTGINTPARSRYSTFMFSGISLASGGAPLEYGEALSAVLPLETKDYSTINKVGVNASVVGIGGGGTRAFTKGSLSVDLNYQHLGLYDKIYSGRREFKEPYRMASAAFQGRYTPDKRTVLKLYGQYDRTDFSSYEGSDRHLFALGEDNAYLNATLRRGLGEAWSLFAGAAYSYNRQGIAGALTAGDRWSRRQQEVHLKAKVSGRLSPLLRLEAGMESYLRNYRDAYRLAGNEYARQVSPAVSAAFLTATYYPVEQLRAEFSLRTAYTAPNSRGELSPRLALNYYLGDVMLSATAGRYTQLPEDSCLARCTELKPEVCAQYNLGAQYQRGGRFYKAELYYKRYSRLALLAEGDAPAAFPTLTSDGYGYSKGFDLFFRDRELLRNLEYQLSYTYNLARRKYLEYTELTTPQYATRHNASAVLKYALPRLHTIIGVTERFSSGRPWHNPDRPGLMNDEVKPYNSLDLGVTFLPSRKVIIHASATNILCRKNQYGKVDGKPILASSDHFFYVGVFITLGKKAAYDVSNF